MKRVEKFGAFDDKNRFLYVEKYNVQLQNFVAS